MATTIKYLEFTVYLTDKADVLALQAQYPDGILTSPDNAALLYSAPVQLKSEEFAAPCTRSGYFLIAAPGGNYPRNVNEFSRKVGGWFGLSVLFGSTYVYKWIGTFAYVTGPDPEIGGTPTEVVAIAQRRWAIGFDLPGGPEGNSLEVDEVSRDASRHADGCGYACRQSGSDISITTNGSGGALSMKTWERFYFRIRKAPDSTARIWRCKLAGGASRGASMNITPDRRIAVHNISDAGVETLQATSTDQFTIDQWYRLDLLLEAANPGGNIEIFIARESIMDVPMPPGVGLGTASNHESSFLGMGAGAGASDTFAIDFDDWIGANWPTEDSNGDYVGIDWLNGSKVATIPVTQFGTGNAWTGDYRVGLHGNPSEADTTAAGRISSSVSGAALVFDVDTSRIKTHFGALGPICFYVAMYLRQLVAGSGTLGWRFDGLLDLASITQQTTAAWEQRMYRPSGLTAPIEDLTPLELHHIKAANTDRADCYAAVAIVELVGTFGNEDIPEGAAEPVDPDSFPARRGIHNAQYPETVWARARFAPVSPVIVHSGTYVGNGTGQDLTFRTNVNWLMIRNTGGGSVGAGGFFWSSLFGGHSAGERLVRPGLPVEARIDLSFVPGGAEDQQEQRTVIKVVGDNAQVNAAGTTYEYIAVMDPGARFHLNGGFAFNANVASFVNALVNTSFVPEYIFFHGEVLGTGTSTVSRYIKGPGHSANAGSVMNAAEGATIAAKAAGQITTLVTLHPAGNVQSGYSAWRQDDGSGDPNAHLVVKVGTYTGDGAASRTITWAPATGKRPLYAIVTPHNATSIHRDPANLTNTSNLMSTGASSTTGITAGGVDSFTVGSTLNANGIVYEWFVLIGSATAGNGGWSIDGEFAYVEPDAPPDGGFDPPDDAIPPVDPDPPPTDPDPDPGPGDDDDCLAGEVCVAATTRVVNQALLEIGSTKVLTNYCTQDTIEAQTARILYEPSVRATLHAFPWPFATKYAALALAATQPTNQDWAFAYRQPVDCIFERRIVVARGPGVDPKGPPFELSSDASGGLIFTNEANAVLEYTMRPACVAFTGDPLFREALKWHLAAAMAPPVTRMADKAKFCREQFDLCIARANAIVRPDDPGLRVTPAWQAVDAGAGCMTANIAVVNLALMRIGCNTIANLTTDQSREATSANLVFEHELRATLRDYPWKFAKRYDAALVLVGGTDTVPVNPDWQYSYRLPSDYVMVRRLVTEGTGRSFEREPKTWEAGTDATGPLLFTGEVDPNLEYTARVGCVVARGDDLFRDALAWRIAASLAPSLAQVDPERPEQPGRTPEHPPDNAQRVSHRPNKAAARQQAARYAFARYLATLALARAQDANEAEPEPDGDAEWIEGRS